MHIIIELRSELFFVSILVALHILQITCRIISNIAMAYSTAVVAVFTLFYLFFNSIDYFLLKIERYSRMNIFLSRVPPLNTGSIIKILESLNLFNSMNTETIFYSRLLFYYYYYVYREFSQKITA